MPGTLRASFRAGMALPAAALRPIIVGRWFATTIRLTGALSADKECQRNAPPGRRRFLSRCGTAIVSAVVLVISYSGAVKADTPSFCASGNSPYQLTSAQRQECGDRSMPLSRVESMRGGGTAYVYVDNAEGSITTFRVPPANFDAATATSEELELYDIPARPLTTSPDYARWVNMAEHMQVEPPPAEIISMPDRAANCPSGSVSNYSCSNWSGYVNTASSQIYTTAESWFTEPETKTTVCGHPAVYTWVGLGGFNSKQLAQAGTSVGVEGVAENEFWWEILPEYMHAIPMPKFYEEGGHPAPGEWAYVQVHSFSNYEFSFFVDTHEKVHSFTTKVSQNGWDGSTADYIVERPEPSFYSLRNFGEVHWEPLTNGKAIESYGHASIEMVNGATKNLLARPGAISSDKFTEYHYNCN